MKSNLSISTLGKSPLHQIYKTEQDQAKADTMWLWLEQQFKDPTEGPFKSLTGELQPLLQPVTSEEVDRALKSLQNGCATGPNGINKQLLKYAGNAISIAISDTTNTVFENYIPFNAVEKGVLVALLKPKKQLDAV